VLSLLPPSLETPALLIGPVVVIIALLLLPFIFGEGEKSWRRRPVAVLSILLVAVHSERLRASLGTRRGARSWTPGAAFPFRPPSAQPIGARTQGALVFQVKQCHNCHSLGDQGGKRGPALDAVAVRLTQDQLIRQVIQGGGNMPAYGKNLDPAQTTALSHS